LPATFTNMASFDFTEKAGSSSIDAGDPADSYSQEPTPNGSRLNQGAFGDTPWAAQTDAPVATSKGGGGGSCGALGMEFLFLLGLLQLTLYLRRR
jgi:hypothetical protein